MSPIYRLEFDMVARIFSQDPLIYGHILMLNPNKKLILKILDKNTKLLKNYIKNNKIKSFVQYFNSTSKYLNKFSRQASKESDELIKFMSKL